MRKNQRPKERKKQRKKEDRKKTKKSPSLEESQQNESNFSLYLYAHVIKNRERT